MSVNDNIRKMNSYEVLRKFRSGEDFICPLCRIPLQTIPENAIDRQSVLGLYCPKNSNHFSIYTEGDRINQGRENIKSIVSNKENKR
ncbi:hypothetical protein SOASR030_04700 [Leminorella grimontii]|uniref:Uncharacterized protein n=1 Tax=Leminorella grimontii TaxID=82981 RepID=A0AAV5MWY7_9GAMM|nr:hypothetical protein [Leminorella grimontii]GKX54358.1 hypothetical protein SOASR030_04700 [Leminorella grimontii]